MKAILFASILFVTHFAHAYRASCTTTLWENEKSTSTLQASISSLPGYPFNQPLGAGFFQQIREKMEPGQPLPVDRSPCVDDRSSMCWEGTYPAPFSSYKNRVCQVDVDMAKDCQFLKTENSFTVDCGSRVKLNFVVDENSMGRVICEKDGQVDSDTQVGKCTVEE